MLQEGELVGPYKIVKQLGQGGMATVYKGYHAQLDRHVAIKVLHQTFQTDENFLARFRREAKIIARLDHPNIVPVYDFNEHKGQPYLVMKFVEGKTLKNVIDRDFPPQRLFDILSSIASALTYAHETGVLHRDIKPTNILIDQDMRPYITDFGLARLAQASQSTLSQDMLMGTPHYISPEQAKGSEDLGPGTDIYSFGVILYEIAVGQVPFSGNTPYAIVHDHIYTPLPSPSTVNPEVSPIVELVLLKALAKDPSERFSRAVEMVNAFKDAYLNPASVNLTLPKDSPLSDRKSIQIVGISSPIQVTKPGQIIPAEQIQPSNNNARWITLASILIALVIVALVIIAASRRDNQSTVLPTLASIKPTDLPPTIASTPTPPPPARPTLPPTRLPPPDLSSQQEIVLYDVPDLSVSQAQAAVQQNPNDPVSYLSLVRAYWKQDQMREAEEPLRTGENLAPDRTAYLLTCAAMAGELDRIAPAIFINVLVLRQSVNTPLYPAIQEIAEKNLYNLALDSNIRSFEYRPPPDEGNSEPPPIFTIMAARAFITQNRLTLADTSLRSLSPEEANSPQAHLVRGELFAAQGDNTRARTEWQAIEQDPTAPQWVRDRAAELLQSLS